MPIERIYIQEDFDAPEHLEKVEYPTDEIDVPEIVATTEELVAAIVPKFQLIVDSFFMGLGRRMDIVDSLSEFIDPEQIEQFKVALFDELNRLNSVINNSETNWERDENKFTVEPAIDEIVMESVGRILALFEVLHVSKRIKQRVQRAVVQGYHAIKEAKSRKADIEKKDASQLNKDEKAQLDQITKTIASREKKSKKREAKFKKLKAEIASLVNTEGDINAIWAAAERLVKHLSEKQYQGIMNVNPEELLAIPDFMDSLKMDVRLVQIDENGSDAPSPEEVERLRELAKKRFKKKFAKKKSILKPAQIVQEEDEDLLETKAELKRLFPKLLLVASIHAFLIAAFVLIMQGVPKCDIGSKDKQKENKPKPAAVTSKTSTSGMSAEAIIDQFRKRKNDEDMLHLVVKQNLEPNLKKKVIAQKFGSLFLKKYRKNQLSPEVINGETYFYVLWYGHFTVKSKIVRDVRGDTNATGELTRTLVLEVEFVGGLKGKEEVKIEVEEDTGEARLKDIVLKFPADANYTDARKTIARFLIKDVENEVKRKNGMRLAEQDISGIRSLANIRVPFKGAYIHAKARFSDYEEVITKEELLPDGRFKFYRSVKFVIEVSFRGFDETIKSDFGYTDELVFTQKDPVFLKGIKRLK